jgi:uncharacterized protein (DUF1697 family)
MKFRKIPICFTTYVALLRGINVGGNNQVSMAELKVCFEKLGYSNVVTYINSGNVIFRSGETDSRKIENTIEKALLNTFAFPICTIVRNFSEMEELISRIPKSWLNAADQKCNVIFLRSAIDHPGILDGLKLKPEIEEVHYHPGVLFWSAKTSNLTKSEMVKLSTTPAYRQMTVRILNTTRKIHEIMRKTDQS